jgi:hypothetical protein
MTTVEKLIADAKKAQDAARAQAAAAAKDAAKNKVEAEVTALSKKQLQYADSLKPTLAEYEAQLRIFANKIARGDKLSAVEQKDFEKLQADYKSVGKTVDAAIKKANDILVEARRGKSSTEVKVTPEAGTTTTTGPDAARVNATSGKSAVSGTSKVDTGAQRTTLPSTGGKTKPYPKPMPNDGSTIFTEPMTISGQVLTTPAGKQSIDDIYAKAASEFGAIDTIFKTNPELASLMTQAVTEKWTPARWSSELQNTNWFKSNATDLQQRGFYKRQYTDLINAIPAGATDRQAQIDALDGSTTYGRGLASIKRLIQAEAIAEGAVIEDAALNTLAQDIYDHALEKDSLAIRDYVKAKIKYEPGKILSGKAGEDLATLKQTAAANGLDIDKAFGTSLQGWLQKLAGGESVETYKNIIRQAAKAGLPERVGSLLDNGVDLETIYTPYKNILASTLEINPKSITLNDPTLRAAIGPDKEMSLYDYQRQLRQDARWQYTNNAREETSNAVMKVLQDFGFKG